MQLSPPTLLSQPNISLPSACSVSHHHIQLTAAGLIRQHGPIAARCGGSHQLPASLPASANSKALFSTPTVTQPLLSIPHEPTFCQKTCLANKEDTSGIEGLCGSKLTSILFSIVSKNDIEAWNNLFHFNSHCLRLPSHNAGSLVAALNKQLSDGPNLASSKQNSNPKKSKLYDPLMSLAARVSAKIKDGDFKGAIHLA